MPRAMRAVTLAEVEQLLGGIPLPEQLPPAQRLIPTPGFFGCHSALLSATSLFQQPPEALAPSPTSDLGG